MSKRLVNIMASVIVGLWAFSFVMSAVRPKYEPPQSIHALMLLVAGAAFGTTVIRNGKRNNGG